MVRYNWTCNACGLGNEPNSSICKNCGCEAGASAEEVEKHNDPEGFKKKQFKNSFQKDLGQLLFLPFSIVLVTFTGRLVFAALIILSIFSLLKFQKKLLSFIFSDLWLRKVIMAASIGMALLLMVRIVFIPDDSVLVIWLSVGIVLGLAIAYLLLFKTSKGKLAFERYYQGSS
ncbi:hypothetical protein [Glaciecola petra]|uniref:RanBP2-type domain-containing protein n=1 Tax=Glaciecola petra TaxID=3075602 RepID=A0ABU2ZKS3_9ALTE|nr:hypothetical protein [Aestuariibacter sp. P117]MDT0593222.1 hypothetical protein [Aestuariibacter sp. P117]